MQAFGNVATTPARKESKSTGKGYWEFRMAEAQKNDKGMEPTWFSCRVMRDEDPKLSKGDFVKVTGKLKADFYLSREGKPTGTLLIIAFEATRIAKPSGVATEATGRDQESPTIDVAGVAAPASTATNSPLRATAEPTPVSASAQAVTPRREASPAPAKLQMAPMQALAAFALPSPAASPWAMSFGAPVSGK